MKKKKYSRIFTTKFMPSGSSVYITINDGICIRGYSDTYPMNRNTDIRIFL